VVNSKAFRLLVLPGDGIGPEIVTETLRVVDWFADYLEIRIDQEHALAGGASIDAHGVPITDAVLQEAREADAILFGAVGGPQWDDLPRADRPEVAILRLRRELDLFANLRPAVCFPELVDASSLRPELVAGVDIMIVRECTSGVYFGEPRGISTDASGERCAVDTQRYESGEIERVMRAAFDIAGNRRGRLCSVDKANVMESGQLWRSVAAEVAADYPHVTLSHLYADNCAMQLLREPKQFDVVVSDNLFGDILSDEAAALCGSLGLLPSATISKAGDAPSRNALYEPIHGSAPDIAGQGIANPLASILSFAMCLEYSLDQRGAADLLVGAIRGVLRNGVRTPDIATVGEQPVSCREMTDAVLGELDQFADHASQAMPS
jgi:3-isopropylmalate dehydrogenase